MSALNKAWIFLKGRDQAKQNKFTHPFDEYGYPVYSREQDPETWKQYDEQGRKRKEMAATRAAIPDELRAGQFDSPGEQERKEMAIRQLQEDAYENNPRTIQRREERKREVMAEMDRDAEKFAAQFEDA